MPANLLPSISRSFGHFSASRWRRPGTRPPMRIVQRERRDERQLRHNAPAAPGRSAAGSHRDCPAPTPRSGRGGRGRRSGVCAVIQSGPRSPARASASASALVEPIVSWAMSRAPAALRRRDRAASEQRLRRDPPPQSISGAGIDEEQEIEQAGDAEHAFSSPGIGIEALAPARRNT